MTDILRRSLAPIGDDAWAAIDEEAKRTFKLHLSGRSVVDVKGPYGWTLGAVDIGRLEIPRKSKSDGVTWGIRRVLPLVEIRSAFKLGQMELDSISRGSADPHLDPVTETARKVALFEETAIYHAFAEGNIQGITKASKQKALTLPKDAKGYPDAVASAVEALQDASIEGPYALVLGTEPYLGLNRSIQPGYPVRRVVERLVGGENLMSTALQGGVLLSTRGGDFELTLGQDLSIGYAGHTREEIELYFTESFAFRVLEPRAAVELKKSSR